MNCHLQAPTSAKQGKHRRTHDEMHKILRPRNATYKEAHKSEKTGAPRKMHLRIRLRAHMSAYQRRYSRGTFTWGSADPQVRPNLDKRLSRCSSTWSSPYSYLSRGDKVSILEKDQGGNIPRISTPPRHLHHYIKGLSPPPLINHSFIHHTPFLM